MTNNANVVIPNEANVSITEPLHVFRLENDFRIKETKIVK